MPVVHNLLLPIQFIVTTCNIIYIPRFNSVILLRYCPGLSMLQTGLCQEKNNINILIPPENNTKHIYKDFIYHPPNPHPPSYCACFQILVADSSALASQDIEFQVVLQRTTISSSLHLPLHGLLSFTPLLSVNAPISTSIVPRLSPLVSFTPVNASSP